MPVPGDHVDRADGVDDVDYLASLDGSVSADLDELRGASDVDPVGDLHGLWWAADPPAVAGVTVTAGTFFQGSVVRAARRVGWLCLMVST